MGCRITRRVFCQNVLVAPPVAMLSASALAQTPPPTAASTAAKWVDAEKDATAKALGYVVDATKADRPKKGGVEGKDQFCSNCQLYQKGAPIDGQEAGKCLMLPSGLVPGAAWCKSWVKKA